MRHDERRTLVVIGMAVGALVLVAVLSLPALYYLGLSFVPEKARPTATEPLPPVVSAALWAVVGGDGPPQMKPISAWSFVKLRVCRAMGSQSSSSPAVRAKAKEDCIRRQPGLAGVVPLARLHIVRNGLRVPSARGELAQVATGIWLTRNWTTDALLKELAAQGNFGHGWRGMNLAAIRYFGEQLDTLTPADAALLAASLRDMEIPAIDPLCDKAGAIERRNVILERMYRNGALSKESMPIYLRQPLGVVERPCQ